MRARRHPAGQNHLHRAILAPFAEFAAALAARNVTGEHRTILAVRNCNVELDRVLLDTAARREPFRRMHERRLKPSSEGPGASHQNKCAVGLCRPWQMRRDKT